MRHAYLTEADDAYSRKIRRRHTGKVNQQEQLHFFYEILHPSLPRLGPGDRASTTRALGMLLPESGTSVVPHGTGLQVLDIGCGNGASTIELAKLVQGEIAALDNHQPYLDELKRRAEAEGVFGNIQLQLMDMRELRTDKPTYDLIWSEGALYFFGFAQGLAGCRSLLRPGGSMAVSELCFLRPDPPAECARYFAEAYPAMTDVERNLGAIRGAGFDSLLGHFALPETAWWESYYGPLQKRLQLLREKHAADTERTVMIGLVETEIDMYRRFSEYYGYVFYVMRG